MNFIFKVFSHRNWGMVRYNAIFQDLTALFYIALKKSEWNLVFIRNSFLFFLFSLLMTAFGYLVNDLSDIELDRQHGKPNAFTHLSRAKAAIIITAVLLVGLIVPLPFLENTWFRFFLVVWILTATVYSLPPLRLKERGGWGLVMTILAQQTLPLILLFAAFGMTLNGAVMAFITYVTMRGLSSDLGHQVRDWENDARTETRTFAVRLGYEKARRLYMVSLEAERFLTGVVLVCLYFEIEAVTLPFTGWHLSPVLPLLIAFVLLYLRTAGSTWRSWKKGQLTENDPYDEARQARRLDSLHILHHTFPSVLTPLYLSILITLAYLPNIVFILFIILVFNLYKKAVWFRFLPSGSRKCKKGQEVPNG